MGFNRNYRNLFVFSLLITAIAFTRCKTLQNLADARKPHLSVKDVRVTDFAFDEIELTFDVEVENPNPVDLRLLSYNYDFNINGNTFIQGTRDKGLAIEASESSIIHVPVQLDFQQLYSLYNSLKGEAKANYALLADLTFNLPVLGKTTIPLKKTGEIPLIKIPDISVAGLEVQEMNLSNIDFELLLQVKNPNAFGLILNALSYRFEVNNEEWIESRFTNKVKVSKNETGTISIPISLNTLNIGTSVVRLLQNAEDLDYSLEGTIDFTAGHPLLGDTDFSFFEKGQLPVMIQ